jgi:leucine-rich repeat protein SHOC2
MARGAGRRGSGAEPSSPGAEAEPSSPDAEAEPSSLGAEPLLGPSTSSPASPPDEYLCPITRVAFRDPAMVVASGHTYERRAIREHFRRNGRVDPLTRRALPAPSSVPGASLPPSGLVTNWAVRRFVEAWLERHPGVVPEGWPDRDVPPPPADDDQGLDDDDATLDDAAERAAVEDLLSTATTPPPLQAAAAAAESSRAIECEAREGRVVALELDRRGLRGPVPASVGALTAMTRLQLSDNALTSIPSEIASCASLARVYLSGNRLEDVPVELGALRNLEELYLDGNCLTRLPREMFERPAGSSVIGRTIGGASVTPPFPSLVRLSLSCNAIREIPDALDGCPKLRGLYLDGNRLERVPGCVARLAALKVLSVAGNPFREGRDAEGGDASHEALVDALRKRGVTVVDA